MKEEIIAEIIRVQEQRLEDLNTESKSKMDNADLDEEDTRDDDDFSQQDQSMDMVSFYEEQMAKAQENIASLKQYQYSEQSEVGEGALVTTKEAFYLFGASFTNQKYDNKTVYGITMGSPAYEQNEGKTKGKMLQVGPNEQKILNIE